MRIPLTGGGMGVRWGAIYKRSVKIAAASRTGVYSLILVTLGCACLAIAVEKPVWSCFNSGMGTWILVAAFGESQSTQNVPEHPTGNWAPTAGE